MAFEYRLEVGRQRWRFHFAQHVRALFDDRHLDAPLAERRGDFHADKAGPDHHRVLRRARTGPERLRIRDGSQIMNPAEFSPRDC